MDEFLVAEAELVFWLLLRITHRPWPINHECWPQLLDFHDNGVPLLLLHRLSARLEERCKKFCDKLKKSTVSD